MFSVYIVKRKSLVMISSALVLTLLLLVGFHSVSQDVFLAKPVQERTAVPILMYHSILKDPKYNGAYVVSPQVFRDDMLYLKQQGYTAVFVSELIDYVYSKKKLPPKPVIITLDDGYLNNLTYILPVLEETDMKAVVSVIGIHSELYSKKNDPNPLYAHLTWANIQTLQSSNRVEIGNHTYNMHDTKKRKGSMRKAGESVEQYQAVLKDDIGKLQAMLKEQTDIVPAVFTYPYGFVSPEALPVLKEMGFQAAFTCEERVNYITSDKEQLYHLGRFNRPAGISTAKFMEKIIGES